MKNAVEALHMLGVIDGEPIFGVCREICALCAVPAELADRGEVSKLLRAEISTNAHTVAVADEMSLLPERSKLMLIELIFPH